MVGCRPSEPLTPLRSDRGEVSGQEREDIFSSIQFTVRVLFLLYLFFRIFRQVSNLPKRPLSEVGRKKQMIACNACPTCGGPAGPPTPEQEVETASRGTSSTAVKCLTQCFESLEVSRASSKDAAATEPTVSPIKDMINRNIDSSDDEVIPAPIVWPPAAPQLHEPILEDNDERFCLLPVK